MNNTKITMPKACVSCQHFTFVGTADDQHCPFKGPHSWSAPKTRTRYGRCSKTKTNVFITELCPSFTAEPDIEIIDVTNRLAPMQPRQHVLF